MCLLFLRFLKRKPHGGYKQAYAKGEDWAKTDQRFTTRFYRRDFDRSIASAEVGQNYDHLHDGVLLIRRQLSQMLENKYSLKRFESKGALFDPNRHEALFAEPGDVEEPVVSEEYLPGYELHDRILRTAKVRVKMPAPKKQPEANSAEAGSPESEAQMPDASKSQA